MIGESRTEYNVRYRNPHTGRWVITSDLSSYEPDSDMAHTRETFGPETHEVHRTECTFPDGSRWTGPWQPPEPSYPPAAAASNRLYDPRCGHGKPIPGTGCARGINTCVYPECTYPEAARRD